MHKRKFDFAHVLILEHSKCSLREGNQWGEFTAVNSLFFQLKCIEWTGNRWGRSSLKLGVGVNKGQMQEFIDATTNLVGGVSLQISKV